MGIGKIDFNKCFGGVICVDNRPMDVIRTDDVVKKPCIQYLRDCQPCYLCKLDYRVQSIYVTPERERRIPLPW
jgi:NAD-dependent dihydropyrimidine dehydrogenase PreA subunit